MNALVIQTDFGVKDGAVASMKGIAFGVDSRLPIFDLSQENTPFDIWEAAYRLKQTAAFWPAGTVFVSVIDPGVGTERPSVVLQTKSGHFFVGPDNGTWTLIAEELGIEAVREIDETVNRLAGSEKSYTFHGRDIYAFTGARLASGKISFEKVGPLLEPAVLSIPYQKPAREGNALSGAIPFLDIQYGHVWTNIPDTMLAELNPAFGDNFSVTVLQGEKEVYRGIIPYVRTFEDVPEGAPLIYINSLLNVAFGLNYENFAKRYGVSFGGDWSVVIEKVQ